MIYDILEYLLCLALHLLLNLANHAHHQATSNPMIEITLNFNIQSEIKFKLSYIVLNLLTAFSISSSIPWTCKLTSFLVSSFTSSLLSLSSSIYIKYIRVFLV